MSASKPTLWEKVGGVLGSAFQVGGSSGPLWQAVGAQILEARRSDLGALVTVRGGPPLGQNDLTPKGYVDTLAKPLIVTLQWDGNNALPSNSATLRFYVVTTSGAFATVGQLLFDDGSNVGTVTVLSTLAGRVISVPVTLTGGAIGGLGPNALYLWNGSAWQVAGGSGGGVAVFAGLGTGSTGTVSFSNSNGITFGLTNNVVTASVAPGMVVAAGTQTALSGTAVFSNSNNVTFGMSGNSRVTASVSYAPTLSQWANLSGPMWQGATFGRLSVVPLAVNPFPGQMTVGTMHVGLNGASSQSTASGAITFGFGVYSLNGSTLSLQNSASTGFSWGAVSDCSTGFGGFRWLELTSWSASPVFTQTQYWLAYSVSTSNATQGFSWLGQAFANAQGRMGSLGVAATQTAGSLGWYPLMGAWTGTGTDFPSTIGQADLDAAATSVGHFLPHVVLDNAWSRF